MCQSDTETETEKEAEKIGNISYMLDSTRIEHCVKLDVKVMVECILWMEKNKGRKMISPFLLWLRRFAILQRGIFCLKESIRSAT